MLTVKAPVTYTGNVFGFYTESADPKIAVHLMENGHVMFYYEDATRDFDQPFKRYPTFTVNVTDAKYVRLCFITYNLYPGATILQMA